MADSVRDTSGEEDDMSGGASAGTTRRGDPRPVTGTVPHRSPGPRIQTDVSVADFYDVFDEPDVPKARTIACVDVRVAPDDTLDLVVPPSAVLAFALRRVQRAVRADDRICAFGGSRLAVVFGSGADVVPPRVLGERLARAVASPLRVAGTTVDLEVSVGVASGAADLDPVDITAVALRTSGVARRRLGALPDASRRRTPAALAVAGILQLKRPTAATAERTAPHSATTAITTATSVTDVTDACVADAAAVTTDMARHAHHHVATRSQCAALHLHRRTVSAYSAQRLAGGTVTPTPRLAGDATDELDVLVIDPLPTMPETPGLAAEAVASVVERHGCRATLTAAGPGGELPAEIDDSEPDVVVLVLHSATSATRRRDPVATSASSWSIPARLTAAFTAAGSRVVAVGMGAGAAVLAGCVEQGASALFDVEHLPDQLQLLQRSAAATDSQSAAARSNGAPPAGRMPGPFEALVQLTSSERRVLYHLTEGWGAQEIADQLVVSLTTVRSHIRSILRKLNVKSQLAAVAIANGLNVDDLAEREPPAAPPLG